jgi:hypothetical protein
MDKSNPSVIGEGSYGCVHAPSLECNESGMDYTNKVSKILLRRHANTELQEYLGIQTADPDNQFFLGVPIRCKPKQTESNYEAIKKCDIGKEATSSPDKTIKPDYDLLIMENGGMNLRDFAISMADKPATPENQAIMEKFWIECHRLFLGLSVFIDQNLLHHDLKAQNIVYNPEKNRVAFIDFGLMTTYDKKFHDVINYKTKEEFIKLIHWSYPIETIFYNRNSYNSDEPKKRLLKALDKNGSAGIYDKGFLYNVLPKDDSDPDIKRHYMDIDLQFDFIALVNSTRKNSYEDFLKKSIYTFDLYGVCMGLMYVFNKTYHILKESGSKIDYKNLSFILKRGICANIDNRYYVDEFLEVYEDMILKDIMLDSDLRFLNHIPVVIPSAPPPPMPDSSIMSDEEASKYMEEKDEKQKELMIEKMEKGIGADKSFDFPRAPPPSKLSTVSESDFYKTTEPDGISKNYITQDANPYNSESNKLNDYTNSIFYPINQKEKRSGGKNKRKSIRKMKHRKSIQKKQSRKYRHYK